MYFKVSELDCAIDKPLIITQVSLRVYSDLVRLEQLFRNRERLTPKIVLFGSDVNTAIAFGYGIKQAGRDHLNVECGLVSGRFNSSPGAFRWQWEP